VTGKKIVIPEDNELRSEVQIDNFVEEEVVDDKEDKVDITYEEPSKITNLWFISDCELDGNIKEQLSAHYSNIQNWNRECFTNRSPKVMLEEFGIDHMWTCIKNKHALEYVRQFVKKNTTYTTILVHKSTKNGKHQKWVSQLMALEGAIDVKIRSKDLRKMHSLTLTGLMDVISDSIHINPPASLMASIIGCSKHLLKKNVRSE
jgi:hypothetical protein